MDQRNVAACLPVDASRLPKLDVRTPAAMIDDMRMACERCGEPIWVGPRKLAMWKQGGAELMCYYCVIDVVEASNAPTAFFNLDPGRVEVPRTIKQDGQ